MINCFLYSKFPTFTRDCKSTKLYQTSTISIIFCSDLNCANNFFILPLGTIFVSVIPPPYSFPSHLPYLFNRHNVVRVKRHLHSKMSLKIIYGNTTITSTHSVFLQSAPESTAFENQRSIGIHTFCSRSHAQTGSFGRISWIHLS